MVSRELSPSTTVATPKSAAPDPSVSEWVPLVPVEGMTTLKAKAVGSRSLAKRRSNPKRGRIGGKRYVAMWKVKGDDTYLIEIGAGEHVQRLRLSRDALEAIESLHAEAEGGGSPWRFIYRVVAEADAAKAVGTSAPASSGEAVATGQTPGGEQ